MIAFVTICHNVHLYSSTLILTAKIELLHLFLNNTAIEVADPGQWRKNPVEQQKHSTP